MSDDRIWRLTARQMVDMYVDAAREVLVGHAKFETHNALYGAQREYHDGALAELGERGREQALAAKAAVYEIDPAFEWKVRAEAARVRSVTYGGSLSYEALQFTAWPTVGVENERYRLDPEWSRRLFPTHSEHLRDTAAALDDVLAGKRFWYPDYSGGGVGSGELRRNEHVLEWLTDAIDQAAVEAVPDREPLYRAGSVQIAATAELLEARRLDNDRSLPYAERAAAAEPNYAAGAAHVRAVDTTLAGWVGAFLTKFDAVAPKRLAEIIEESGHGDKLGVTHRMAAERRAERDRQARQAFAEREQALGPRDAREVALPPTMRDTAPQSATGQAEPPPFDVTDTARRNTVENVRSPAPSQIARLHPWTDALVQRGHRPPLAVAVPAHKESAAPQLPPGIGAGLPGVRPRSGAAPTAALPSDVPLADTARPADLGPATAVNRGGPKIPTYGAVRELETALTR